jgi:hypothetical protein
MFSDCHLTEVSDDEDNPEHDRLRQGPELIEAKKIDISKVPIQQLPKIKACFNETSLEVLLYWDTLVSYAQAINTLRRLNTNPFWADDLVKVLRQRASALRPLKDSGDPLNVLPNHLEDVMKRVPTTSKPKYSLLLRTLQETVQSAQYKNDYPRAASALLSGKDNNNIDKPFIIMFAPLANFTLKELALEVLIIGVDFLENELLDAIIRADKLRVKIINLTQQSNLPGPKLPPPIAGIPPPQTGIYSNHALAYVDQGSVVNYTNAPQPNV